MLFPMVQTIFKNKICFESYDVKHVWFRQFHYIEKWAYSCFQPQRLKIRHRDYLQSIPHTFLRTTSPDFEFCLQVQLHSSTERVRLWRISQYEYPRLNSPIPNTLHVLYMNLTQNFVLFRMVQLEMLCNKN
jgi:hypothetical protein